MTMQKRLRGMVLTVAMTFAAYVCYAETVTVSTFYPSPFGSYQDLTVTRNASLATTSGNVGIGNTNPGAKLDVTGNLLLSGSRSTIFTTGDNTTTHRGGIQIVTYNNGVDMVWTPTNQSGTPINGAIHFGGGGFFNSNLVGFSTSGNVGIGPLITGASSINNNYAITIAGNGKIGINRAGANDPGELKIAQSPTDNQYYAVYAP